MPLHSLPWPSSLHLCLYWVLLHRELVRLPMIDSNKCSLQLILKEQKDAESSVNKSKRLTRWVIYSLIAIIIVGTFFFYVYYVAGQCSRLNDQGWFLDSQ